MDNWALDIAKEFKKRNNPNPLGAMLGVIVSPLPDVKIKLLSGGAVITKNQIYLSNAITNRLAIECTIKEFESTNNKFIGGKNGTKAEINMGGMSSSGSGTTERGGAVLSLSGHSGSMGSLAISDFANEKEIKEKGKFILQTIFNLASGMFVLVIPNQEEDKFFVVDVFTYAPEVNLDWEYYQK